MSSCNASYSTLNTLLFDHIFQKYIDLFCRLHSITTMCNPFFSQKKKAQKSFFLRKLIFLIALSVHFTIFASDFDKDQLPDEWEVQYGLSTNLNQNTNLVGWWQVDELPNKTILDRSTNQLNGISTNNSTLVAGLFNQALNFSPTSIVKIASQTVLQFTNQFTISLWFKGSPSTKLSTLVSWFGQNNKLWQLGVGTNGQTEFVFTDANNISQVITSLPSVRDNQWHQLAATFQNVNSLASLYVDGKLKTSAPIDNWTLQPATQFIFGLDPMLPSQTPFLLDEIQLYRTSLDASQIPNFPDTYADPDGDGLSNLEEYKAQTNPTNADTDGDKVEDDEDKFPNDYYNDVLPQLFKISGDQQTASVNTLLKDPLIVQIIDTNNVPLINAPVTFKIQLGLATIAPNINGPWETEQAVQTDAEGKARIYVKMSDKPGAKDLIAALVQSGQKSKQVLFEANTAMIPVEGLVLWLKADEGVTNVKPNLVQNWFDYSGRGNSAQQTNTTSQPQFLEQAINNKPVIRFDGTNDFLKLPAATLQNQSLNNFTQGLSIYLVARPNQLQSSAPFFMLSRGLNDIISLKYYKMDDFTEFSTDLEYYLRNGDASPITTPAYDAITENIFQTWSLVQTPTQTNQVTLKTNGKIFATNTMVLPVYNPAQPRYDNNLGKSAYFNQPYFKGDFAEILFFNRALNDQEQLEVNFYLYQKYKLPFYLPPPTFNPTNGASADNALEVTITSPVKPFNDISIYLRYTLDGSEPKWESPGVSKPETKIVLNESRLIKARVFLDPYTSSEISSAQYYIDDTDKDGMSNDWELKHGLNPNDPNDALLDADKDGLNNLQEFLLKTDPQDSDTNDDGLTDYVSLQLGIEPLDLDTDNDDLTNLQELQLGTNPLLPDTDGDGVWDAKDFYPLDPSRSEKKPIDPNDQKPPKINLQLPANATLVNP